MNVKGDIPYRQSSVSNIDDNNTPSAVITSDGETWSLTARQKHILLLHNCYWMAFMQHSISEILPR